MKRRSRILLQVLLPAPLATSMMLSPVALRTPVEWLFAAAVYSIPAYVIAGLPSLGYAWLMERAYARGVAVGGWKALGLSTLLGGFAGVLIIAVFAAPALWEPVSFRASEICHLAVIGAGVGALIGVIMMFLERCARARARVDTVRRSASISGP